MTGNGRLDENRGNRADYVLGTVEGWDAFEVVRWHGVDELSCPFEFEITLRRAADKGPVDLDALLDSGATFRVVTARRWRTVHGVVAEIEEIDRTTTFFYYRLLLVPPLWRMQHRKRCRTFTYRTIQDVLTCVLENRAHPGATPIAGLLPFSGEIAADDSPPDSVSFTEPHGRFVWRVTDERRLGNKDLHPFVAQYNESDFDFLARWLAAEGIAYYFEHTADAVVVVLTDAPGQDAPHESDREAVLRGGAVAGAHRDQEIVRWLRDARRMRSRAVTMREYDYRRSGQVFDARHASEGASPEAFGHFEFPAKDDRLSDKLAQFPAERRLQRFEAERRLRQGMSTVRTLAPGHTLRLRDGDGLRDEEELLIVRCEAFGTQHSMEGSLLAGEPFGWRDAGQEVGGYENRFEVLPADVPYRPVAPPPRERIWGVQVARVWGPAGDLGAPVDIHCDEHGRIRVQFPWDTRNVQDGQPSSDWCRVAQPWAGAAYGAVHIPRVGHEVLVAFENGDPDRPVIVGSVYTHPDTPPPYDASDARNKTRTTIKSRSTSVAETAEGYNELQFTDYKGEEEVFLHAERDLNEIVEHDHSTSVGGDQSNSVGGNQSNSVGHNRTHDVTGTENVHVHGDRTTTFDANESHKVGVNRSTDIGAVERLEVGASRVVVVHGPDMAIVDSDDVTQVGGTRTVQVHGDHNVQTDASYHSSASGNHTMDSTNMYVTQAGAFQVNATSLWLNVGGCSLRMSAGNVSIDNGAGASITLAGGMVSLVAPGITYPDHHHPPEEVYVVLSPGEWKHGGSDWFAPGYGGLVYNVSDTVHAMRAGADPLLAIWCLWVGDKGEA